MSISSLLHFMDKATNPGNFLRAMLVYYDQPMIFPVGNTSINSGNINNPENRKTASQLDLVYRFMRMIDTKNIMNPERAMRFLTLCTDLLSQVTVNAPRRDDDKTKSIYKDRLRELDAAKAEIRYAVADASRTSGINLSSMRKKIDSDRRRYWGESTQSSPKTTTTSPSRSQPAKPVSVATFGL